MIRRGEYARQTGASLDTGQESRDQDGVERIVGETSKLG